MTDKALAKIFKALGDETRLEIVRMLAGKERCVCAFLSTFSMTQPAISNHLRVLREAGIPMAQGFLYSRPLPARALQAFQAWHETPAAERARPPGP